MSCSRIIQDSGVGDKYIETLLWSLDRWGEVVYDRERLERESEKESKMIGIAVCIFVAVVVVTIVLVFEDSGNEPW